MTRMMALLAAMVMMGVCGAARAGLVIDVSQAGNDVVFQTEAGGTLNLTGLKYLYSGNNYGTAIQPNLAVIASLPAGNTNMAVYSGFTSAPTNFGTGDTVDGSGTGTPLVLYGSNSYGYLETAFLFSGGAVSFTDTFNNATFSSLGLTPGQYTWSWSGDSIVLNIPASVPEPASMLMTIGGLSLAALTLAGRSKRRRLASPPRRQV